ncbi:MAG: M20/M25/M40 family metallo-hydrolase [Pseudomonadota bacterium]|nr:M20/M25/M40 family metallo-hydrolase [Pseudomonadota bacterium]
MVAQGRLTLIRGGAYGSRPSTTQEAIAELIADLVRFPTQGGIDPQEPALRFLAAWLEQFGVPVRILEAPHRKPKNRALGLLAEIGPPRGPVYCLTACLDTALFGTADTWEGRTPTSATVTADGWLLGRGSADSKAGVAIFSTLMAELKQKEHLLGGRILLLIDSDEHTGRFGAVKSLVRIYKRLHGVFIGYPGNDSIKIGARGFYRGRVSFFGVASHSGAARPASQNAVERAAYFIHILQNSPLSGGEVSGRFELGAQRTVTAISGGRGYSTVPDYCFVRVDYRLTPSFTLSDARQNLRSAVEQVDRDMPTSRGSRINAEQSWPAYKLDPRSRLVQALASAAEEELGRIPDLRVSGPSNVGNFLSAAGIDATCGFGVTHRNIHAANEAIMLSSITPVYRAYMRAILDLCKGAETGAGS